MSVDTAIGFGAGAITAGLLWMFATDRLIHHYLRRGWCRFPDTRRKR